MAQPLKIEITELSPVERRLSVVVSRERMGAVRDKVTREFMQNANLPGFRRGKVPRDIVESRFHKEISARTRSTIINETLEEVVRTHNLPVVALKGLDLGEEKEDRGEDDFRFSLTLEILPEVSLSEIPKLKVKKPIRPVTEEEVHTVLENLRERFTRFRPPEEGEVASLGDRIQFEYRARKEGEDFPEKPETYQGILSPRYLLPPVCEQLVGIAMGERREFTIPFGDSPEIPESLKGQTLHYEIKILSLEKGIPFEFTPENLKTHFEDSDLESFRARIRKSLEISHEEESEQVVMGELRRSLGELLQFPVPDSLVEEELKRLLSSVLEGNQLQGYPPDAREEMAKQLFEKLTPIALKNVRVSLALEKIANLAGVAPTEEEVNIELSRLAREYRIDPQQFFRKASEGGIRDRVYSFLKEQKALGILREKADLSEISWSEWEKEKDDREPKDEFTPTPSSQGKEV